jgi:lipopolysaccharide transport system ATP-binding protein
MHAMLFESVSKRFVMGHDRAKSFQDLMLRTLRPSSRAPREILWAMRDVSFEIEPGEAVAIVGRNGSGKSTCLKLMTRILTPTEGSVDIQGRVAGLLELGAGFHPELTGRDNIYLNGALMGLSRREIALRFDEIVAFSELERFIDAQVKFYSSGMTMRLGFSIAVCVDPDILLIDEVLAVGDQSFQEKCLERIERVREKGVTIIFVSHALETVRALCERVLWLDEGELREDGACDLVVDHYIAAVHQHEEVAVE